MPSALLNTLLYSNFHRFQFFRAVIGTTKTPSGRTYAALLSPQMTQRTDGATPREYLKVGRDEVKKMVAHKIVDVLGSDNKM